MTVLMSVRIAAGWVNAQMKLFQVKSPLLFRNDSPVVRIAG